MRAWLLLGLLAALLVAGCGGDDEESGGGTTETQTVDPAVHRELREAVRANDVAEARRLLQAGADPNQLDTNRESAFLLAASETNDDPALVRLLLEHGGDVVATDAQGDTALLRAARRGYPKVVEAIVEANPPLDHVNQLGWTALMSAVVLGDGSPPFAQTIRHLVEAGADPNVGDANGIPAIVHAQAAGQAEIVRILQAAGR